MARTPALLAVALVAAACGAGTTADPTTTAAPTTATTQPARTTTAPPASTTVVPPSTTTDPPTTTTVPAPATATLSIDGEMEVVFDWTTDRCDDLDIPDLPARAFRDAEGSVHLISTHTTAREMTGSDFDSLHHPCAPIFRSRHDPDPAAFADSEWIAATYTADGETVYALIHNEYHGWERGDCTGGNAFDCWYNAITAAVSTDGGATFERLGSPPEHLVAALPHRYEADTAPVGLFSPSNIVEGGDGHHYALAKVGAHLTGAQTVCLMRTPDLAEPSAWRFWDGEGFGGVFVDPYRTEIHDPSAHECPALAPDAIGAQMIESLSWSTTLERWVLVGLSADTIEGREVWGVYYSFSDDLLEWTRRRLLLEIELPWTVDDPGSDLSYLYPSLIDHSSESFNFETVGDTAYLYLTRNNAGHASLDRDLVRIPVRIEIDG